MTTEYRNFFHYSSRLNMAGVLGDVHVELLKLKKADSWFMFTRDLLLKHEILTSTLDVNDEYDDPNKSKSLRKNGNVFFKARLYWKAVDMYNRCLKACKPNTECHALAQANRSAAYFHMGQYEHCLKDALCVVESDNYPSNLVYKLHERIGHVEHILGYTERAKKSYALCLKRLDEADMSAVKKRKFRMAISIAVSNCEEVEEEPTKSTTTMETLCVEQLVGGKNENIPALSAFVELKLSENMGRGVYATCDINPGDVVAIDEPYICGPLSEFREVCHYNGCMKIHSSLIHCPKCLLVFYCNKDCMNKDYKDGHNLLCPIMYHIKSRPGITKINELAIKWFLRAYSKMGLKKYCAIVDNFSESKIDPIKRGFDEIGQYKSDDFLTAYSLDIIVNEMSIDVLFFFNCIAVDMLHYLMLSGFKIPECYIAS
ncbi:SET and MYND domain-containing protein 4 isoform X2 [Acyrthosiphon pisum]|uniref:MYND-type domain-containing protein n=1 Tax=Acyrthosiphon pisum TaxID=7029 RepID=A0A8R2H7G6_ACYPI|nr:SET and MYND domain-containing protein 4 isoform X2 [Acyrthosiphon pisum]|eukprot:XP_016664121.1 PREDICTED: SET and MYND domain-containing protein 4 isoform X2 [Acyrthosiphon pisum]